MDVIRPIHLTNSKPTSKLVPDQEGDQSVERSFSEEIRSLSLGAGETFHGEGLLAVTKALLQSGVSYVGGYQGPPVSHLLDVMVQARETMDELGVHVEARTREAPALRVGPDSDGAALTRRAAPPRLRFGVAAWGEVFVTAERCS